MTTAAKALLLDLDGTLVATDELHFQATMSVLPEFGITLDRAAYMADIHGGANDDIKHALFGDRARTVGAEYVARKEAAFRDLLASVPTVPGALDLLDRARRAGIRLAVVTNAPRENAELLLVPLGGGPAFDAVILGDELERGKPHPLPYLLALSQLDVAPANACGFEDSVNGVTALARAGVYPIGIAGGLYAAELRSAGARQVVADLQWAGLSSIAKLMRLFTVAPSI
jgi:HAD superfamily hydrolase (TIGR01509 family)